MLRARIGLPRAASSIAIYPPERPAEHVRILRPARLKHVLRHVDESLETVVLFGIAVVRHAVAGQVE